MAVMMISANFEIGDVVYVKTDMEQHPCIVTGINIRPGHLTYMLTRDDSTSCFYDFEITTTKNIKAL